jgi:protein-S-isoprenylcysteine O-methyltransferase Ste14
VSYGIRPSATQNTAALWAKSLLNAVLFFAVFMVALPLLARRLLPVALPLPGPLAGVAGAVLCIGGLAVWAVCLDHFSRRGRGTPFPLDAPQELVTSGPFGVIRNPIMAGELAVIWGEALLFNQLGIAVYALLVTVLGHVAITRIEEPELGERFGATYAAYSSRVPRWFPALRP